jgi:hypothetical protein
MERSSILFGTRTTEVQVPVEKSFVPAEGGDGSGDTLSPAFSVMYRSVLHMMFVVISSYRRIRTNDGERRKDAISMIFFVFHLSLFWTDENNHEK